MNKEGKKTKEKKKKKLESPPKRAYLAGGGISHNPKERTVSSRGSGAITKQLMGEGGRRRREGESRNHMNVVIRKKKRIGGFRYKTRSPC